MSWAQWTKTPGSHERAGPGRVVIFQRASGVWLVTSGPAGIPLLDGMWVEEGSLIQLNAAVYGLVNALLHGGRQLCAELKILGTGGHAMTLACSVWWVGQDHKAMFSSRWMILPLTGMPYTQKTWRTSGRPSSSASERASTTVKATMPAGPSFKTSLMVSTSIRASLFESDWPLS